MHDHGARSSQSRAPFCLWRHSTPANIRRSGRRTTWARPAALSIRRGPRVSRRASLVGGLRTRRLSCSVSLPPPAAVATSSADAVGMRTTRLSPSMVGSRSVLHRGARTIGATRGPRSALARVDDFFSSSVDHHRRRASPRDEYRGPPGVFVHRVGPECPKTWAPPAVGDVQPGGNAAGEALDSCGFALTPLHGPGTPHCLPT